MAEEKHTAQEAYRILHDVFSHPRMAHVIAELETNSTAQAEAKKDTRAYLHSQGIELPKDVKAHFLPNHWKFSLCIWVFCIHFEHD